MKGNLLSAQFGNCLGKLSCFPLTWKTAEEFLSQLAAVPISTFHTWDHDRVQTAPTNPFPLNLDNTEGLTPLSLASSMLLLLLLLGNAVCIGVLSTQEHVPKSTVLGTLLLQHSLCSKQRDKGPTAAFAPTATRSIRRQLGSCAVKGLC